MANITVTYLGDLRTEAIHIDSNSSIITDAPVDNQGLGRKFSPTDLVASSLGSCLLTIMGIAAKTHGINIDKYNSKLPELSSFILPGGNEINIWLHLARTVCRRAERIAVSIENMNLLNNKMILSYLNRLSDLLYVLARYVDREKEYLKATE